jgi:hypothetical protein
MLISTMIVSFTFCQMSYPVNSDAQVKNIHENWNTYFRDSSSNPLDSNTAYRFIRDGIVMEAGELKLVKNGNLFPLNSAVTLKNGTIVMPEGIIKMTSGATPSLNDEDFIDMDGNIKSLQSQMNR